MPTTRPRATRPQHASATRPMWLVRAKQTTHLSETRPTSDASATRPGRRPPQACVPTTLNLQAVWLRLLGHHLRKADEGVKQERRLQANASSARGLRLPDRLTQ